MRNKTSRRHLLVCAAAVLSLPWLAAAEPLLGAKVYMLRMKSGFDLHLANALTADGTFSVVADPKIADYVLTESIGSSFEATMDELYREPEPKEESQEDAQEKDAQEKPSDPLDRQLNVYAGGRRTSSFSRGEGTLFLVRRLDRVVVWSTFLERSDTRAAKLNQAAKEVVKRLTKSIREAGSDASATN